MHTNSRDVGLVLVTNTNDAGWVDFSRDLKAGKSLTHDCLRVKGCRQKVHLGDV